MPKKQSIAATEYQNVRYFSKRLSAALGAILDNPLTVVQAPMGYGKTESVRTFLNSTDVKIVWVGTMESSPEYFWPDFCRELSRVVPKSASISSQLALIGFPHDQAQIGAAVKLLGQLSLNRKIVLVFDDCHLLPRSFIGFCEGLAGEPSFNGRIIAITRDTWGAGLRLSPMPKTHSHIDRTVLALTPQEIQEYFEEFSVSISHNEAIELYGSNEGWISALYLNLLWYKKNGTFTSIPEDISQRMRELVWNPLSPEAKELLYTLAPLERFTIAQANRLYGNGAAHLLGELTGKNSFIAFDPERNLYSPHAVFREILRQIFNETPELSDSRRRDIYRACGDELRSVGEMAAAMEAWYKAGDFELALTVLESDLSRNLVTERAAFYVKMFKECPEAVLERHLGAAFKYAIAAFSAGDFQAFENQLKWLGSRLSVLGKTEDVDHWLGELNVLLALTKFNDIKAMSVHHHRALALLKTPTMIYGTDSPWTLGSPSVLFMFHRESGKLREELKLMRECMPPYYQMTTYHGAGAEYLMEAESLYYRGESSQAELFLQKGLEMALRHNQLGLVFCALFLRTRLALFEGDSETIWGNSKKQGILSEARGLIGRSRDGFMLHTADLCEGWLYATLGFFENIPPWLRSKLSQDSRLYTFARGYFPIVHGRSQLLTRNFPELIEEFSTLQTGGAFSNHILFSVYAQIYLAYAFQKTGRSREAAKNLTNALKCALPDNIYLPFAENHDLIGPLMAKTLTGENPEISFPEYALLAEKFQLGRSTVLSELRARRSVLNLTNREIETIRHLAAGLSTSEAAEKMGITVHTVRAHLKSSLHKTGTNSRVALLRIFYNDSDKGIV
ncbi:MAG: LuxR C-terminal-related transcriptional regulator [Deltaproteobacteria bacterium]|jgi:LuxR family maltose regulon positive regulatory protein|nr:LuxR C-terminal-related transcriptional regulator [Deltaproteobacteria bacterium]